MVYVQEQEKMKSEMYLHRSVQTLKAFTRQSGIEGRGYR